MLTAVVTGGAVVRIEFVQAEDEHEAVDCEFPEKDEAGHETGVCEEGPSPIMPEVKELAWGGGAFVLLALVMRFALYPKLKQGMDARYAHIRDTREGADAARAAARAEVAQYDAALATVKAEAAAKVDAARQVLEAERAAKVGEANAAIAVRREAAAAEARAAREAAGSDIATATKDVTARTLELALGKAPDAALVQHAVDSTIGARA